MAEILPFIGMRYNSQLIGNLSKVLSPPYDVITEEFRNELYDRHPNNVVRLELAKEEEEDDGFSNRYTRSANTLGTWRSDGIMIEDDKPAFYLYEQEFKLPNGDTKKRRGFFGLVKLEDPSSGKIKGHEQTFHGPKADRLKLIRATKANVSPIFVIYNDPKAEIFNLISKKMEERPWEEASDDDKVVHRLWVVQKKEFLVSLREAMKSRQLFIADGHHRYESAMGFRNEMREETGKADGKQPYDYMMMYMTNAEQDGLVILPTHRALTRSFMKEFDLKDAMEELLENFDLKKEKVDLDQPETEAKKVQEKLAALGTKGPSFAMILGDGSVTYLCLKKNVDPAELIDDEELHDDLKQLDVSILHHYIINHVMVGNPEFELEDDECIYVRDAKRVLELLKQKKASLAFLMNSIPMDQVISIVSAGIKMPHKSTYFHPKIITGLVVRNMQCETKKPVKTAKTGKR